MKAAVWCRHQGDSIIGIGPNIPWHIRSDFKRFQRLTIGKSLIVGQKTYESFPNRTLPNRKIYVMSFEKNYQVSDTQNHRLVNDVHFFEQIENEEELFISGGAGIYRLFLSDITLAPDYIVDCCYNGPIDTSLTGVPVDVASCVEFMESHYEQYSENLTEDNVFVRLMLKKNTPLNNDITHELFKRIKGE